MSQLEMKAGPVPYSSSQPFIQFRYDARSYIRSVLGN